jgi:transcriptional regulator with XRE-family HTH domain
MTTFNLKNLMNETKLSAEQLAETVGVSGMTIRRWCESRGRSLTPIYQNAVHEAIFRFFLDGRLNWDSEFVQQAFANRRSLDQRAIIKALGLSEGIESLTSDGNERMIIAISHIGAAESRRKRVASGRKKILGLGRRGSDWEVLIKGLIEVTDSRRPVVEKFPAYGALFYLTMPFTLLKAELPIFGTMDSLAILKVAANHYQLSTLAKKDTRGHG